MEQRTLRLGEIVDDYCPRERRITNHAIVALVGDTIKQTRCSTCDAEHVYKGARVPSRKKKDDVAALETAVLASVNGTQLVARVDPGQAQARQAAPRPAEPVSAAETPIAAAPPTSTLPAQPAAASSGEPVPVTRNEEGLAGGWIGHRTLIRATLPRTEGEPPPARPIPEFTMHQRQTRGSHQFRSGNWDRGARGGYRGNGNGEANGNRVGNPNGNSFNHNQGNSFGSGNGGGNANGQPGHGGRKRHRHGKHRRPR